MKSPAKTSLILFLSFCFLSYRGGCLFSFRQAREDKKVARRLAQRELAPGVSPAESRIEELREQIKKYRKQTDKLLALYEREGNLYGVLARKLLDQKYYGPALENFERALKFRPDSAVLFYQKGLSLAGLASIEDRGESRKNLLARAEASYLKALEERNSFAPPLFALAVLYTYEWRKFSEAQSFVARYLTLEKRDIKALFLQARIFVLQGELGQAIRVYDRILKERPSARLRKAAEENRAKVAKEQEKRSHP